MKYYIFSDKNILVASKTHMLPDEISWQHIAQESNVTRIYHDKTSESTSALASENFSFPSEYELIPLRQFFAEHNQEEGAAAARQKGLLEWKQANKFCPSCGSQITDDSLLTANVCTKCGKQYFPRIEPCIIVLISKGSDVLLARHKMRNQNIYTCLAGFIEIGESAEQAVVREVHEEVGLEIQNVQYIGSQGWPFPDQLMFGYHAEYKSGNITIQQDELSDAQWFNKDMLPSIPAAGSMAYTLITSWKKMQQ